MRQIKEALPPGLPWWFYGPPAAPAQRLPPAPVIPGGVPKLAYSVEEAAEALGVSRSLVYRLIHQSGFPSVKLRGRRLISAELLAEWGRLQAGGGAL
ncbi:MAG: helix-turn-helix domain-containing protein [Oscillibacter sp.]|nr:helix-turn-helix domain-containing protein [Oscillibacter sp.]